MEERWGGMKLIESPSLSKNGWLNNLGALDFAGGTVIHGLSGVSALTLTTVVGGCPPTSPHNLVMSIEGFMLLWFGWYAGCRFVSGAVVTFSLFRMGFNGGSVRVHAMFVVVWCSYSAVGWQSQQHCSTRNSEHQLRGSVWYVIREGHGLKDARLSAALGWLVWILMDTVKGRVSTRETSPVVVRTPSLW